MEELKDTYRTITKPSEEVLFKDKNSKFFGYVFPITSEEEAKEHLEELKKKHHSARHCAMPGKLERKRKIIITARTMTANPPIPPGCPFTDKSSLLM